MKEILLEIGAIYLAGITGLYKGVPVGIALKAHPVIITAFTALGSITAVLILYYSGESFKKWITKRIGEDKLEKKKNNFTFWMDRHGTMGLGLIVTGLIGPIVTILLGMTLVRDTGRLLFFVIIGIIIWSAGLTTLGVLGVSIVKYLF